MVKTQPSPRTARRHVSSDLVSGVVLKADAPRERIPGLAKCPPLVERPIADPVIEAYCVRFPKPPKGHSNPFVAGPDPIGVRVLTALCGPPPTVSKLADLIATDPDWRLKVFQAAGRNGISAVRKIEGVAAEFRLIPRRTPHEVLIAQHAAWKASLRSTSMPLTDQD